MIAKMIAIGANMSMDFAVLVCNILELLSKLIVKNFEWLYLIKYCLYYQNLKLKFIIIFLLLRHAMLID